MNISDDDRRIAQDRLQDAIDAGFHPCADDTYDAHIIIVSGVARLCFTIGWTDYVIPDTRWGELPPALAEKIMDAAEGSRRVKLTDGDLDAMRGVRVTVAEFEDHEAERFDGME